MVAKIGLPRSLEHLVLRHCFFGVFGWEGSSPDKTLLNPDVLSSLAKHYAGVLDEMALAGELDNPALRLLLEFLTEPSVSTLGAMVDAIPPRGRMFRQPRGRTRPAADSCRACEEMNAVSRDAMTVDQEAEQVLQFVRQHEFRSAAVMLSRCAGYTHTEIAKRSGITQSRSYRHEKWFEGLPDVNRAGIIALGTTACKSHEAATGGNEHEPATLETFTSAIRSPDAIRAVQAELAKVAHKSHRHAST